LMLRAPSVTQALLLYKLEDVIRGFMKGL